MKSLQVSEYRKRLSYYNKSVVENHDPLIVNLPSQDDVVVLARKDFENLQETIHILKDKTTMTSLIAVRAQNALAEKEPPYKGMNEVFKDVLQD
jgi:prevent-host-death family protein